MTAAYKQYKLQFKQPSGTSRGVLTNKETWFIIINDGTKQGIGEFGVFRGLSIDYRPDFEDTLKWVCNNITKKFDDLMSELIEFPSIQFGLEMAFLSLKSQDKFTLFPSKFTNGKDAISINGLIWMGDLTFMKQQIKTKIEAGFSCIKMKIGALYFKAEVDLLKSIRQEFSVNDIELRVDANGAFLPSEALEKLKILSELDLHSIEQPIKQGQIKEMARLCKETPLPIALDEELIGISTLADKQWLLERIQPHYIILKPSLIGGIKGSNEWIEAAGELSIPWWITSALESNIGLNAISQYTAKFNNPLPQGLGTGQLYTNNIDCPLTLDGDQLTYKQEIKWDLSLFEEQ